MMDRTHSTQDLPDDILCTIDQLMVEQRGVSPGSHMITGDVIGYVAPGRRYRIAPDQLTELGPRTASKNWPQPRIDGTAPVHVRLVGQWDRTETATTAQGNIFGGLGTLVVDGPVLSIPEAPTTRDALSFYGARLLVVGDEIGFETDRNLPITVMDIGTGYVGEFLRIEAEGGGSFVEVHDQPHLHMPLEPSAGGHLLLGRTDDDDYLLSAFRVPFGRTIYTPPNALHTDPYLIYRYLVIYAVTETYSAVVFHTKDGRLIDVGITEPG